MWIRTESSPPTNAISSKFVSDVIVMVVAVPPFDSMDDSNPARYAGKD